MAEVHDHADEHSDDIVAAPGAEQEALGALNGYMDAWNRRDIEGMDAAFHFPHVRIASGSITHLESPASPRRRAAFGYLNFDSDGDTKPYGLRPPESIRSASAASQPVWRSVAQSARNLDQSRP